MRYHTLCVLYVLIVLSGCSQTLSQISNEHGFQRLQAPQKNLEAGTLITYEESGESFTVINPVCWRHQAFPGMPPARSVSRAEHDLMAEFGDWHDLAPTYLEKIQERFPKVDDIELRLANASVSQYSDTDLYKGLATRSKPCQDAVAAREDNGETVFTILKVLNADVTYKVTGVDRNRMVGKLPQRTLERLKTELGGSSVSIFEQTIKGAKLQVAFQPDIIGIDGWTISSADIPTEASMHEKAMTSSENQSDSSPEDETASTDEVNSLSPTEKAAMSATSSADIPNESSMDKKAMTSSENQSDTSPEDETTSTDEVISEPPTEKAAMETSRVPRITKAERELMIKKIAVLSKRRSDADQRQP